MERQFSAGIAVGFFISGVAAILITISQQLGVALIAVGVILGFLFVNPKSPVKKKWWSISNRLGVVPISIIRVDAECITIHIGLRAVSEIKVDRIHLKIGRRDVPSDWESSVVQADEAPYINFSRPQWLCSGEYKGHLVAYTPDGFSKSSKLCIEVSD